MGHLDAEVQGLQGTLLAHDMIQIGKIGGGLEIQQGRIAAVEQGIRGKCCGGRLVR